MYILKMRSACNVKWSLHRCVINSEKVLLGKTVFFRLEGLHCIAAKHVYCNNKTVTKTQCGKHSGKQKMEECSDTGVCFWFILHYLH